MAFLTVFLRGLRRGATAYASCTPASPDRGRRSGVSTEPTKASSTAPDDCVERTAEASEGRDVKRHRAFSLTEGSPTTGLPCARCGVAFKPRDVIAHMVHYVGGGDVVPSVITHYRCGVRRAPRPEDFE